MLLVSLAVLLLALVALYIKYNYSYWQRRKFPYDPDYKIPYGCLENVCKHKQSMGMALYNIYVKSKEPFEGLYFLYRPGLLVRDLQLVHRVLQHDFESFHDRGMYIDEEHDPMSANLMALRGKRWRTMRQKLSPCFSSGKLKAMFGTSLDISNEMVAYLNGKLPEKGSMEMELKQILTYYTIDIVASVFFGLNVNSFRDPSNKFMELIGIVRSNTFIGAVFSIFMFLCPSIAKFLFRCGVKNKVALGLRDIVRDAIEFREKNNIVRKDMLQLLMKLRKGGEISENDDNWEVKESNEHFEPLSLELITAQLFIFYVGGQGSTTSVSALTIFELAQHPDLLQKAQNEVEEVLKQNNGLINYEMLRNMEFLEICVMETIRKYPALLMLNRECTQDYQIPGTDKVIEKGTPVVISLLGLHRNPDYFPKPDEYDPTRFLDAEGKIFKPDAYLPFGGGPRHCIAQRMGMINIKLAIVQILHNFNVDPMPLHELEADSQGQTFEPKGGIKVKLSKK